MQEESKDWGRFENEIIDCQSSPLKRNDENEK